MSFRELMDKYRQGTANDEETRLVEEELDKYDAINEFQYEQIEQLTNRIEAGNDNTAHEGSATAETDAGRIEGFDKTSREEAFIKSIRKEIRKAFIKTGICVGIGAVVIVLFIISVLPGLVSKFYYDPGEIAAESEDEGEGIEATNRMSLDIAVYTELMVPEVRRNLVAVQDNGYGDYDIRIGRSSWSSSEDYGELSGKMTRNKLTMYDPGSLEPMGANRFAWFQRERTDAPLTQQDELEAAAWQKENPGEEGEFLHGIVARQDAGELLDELDDNEKYYAYVTLDEMMDYEDFFSFYTSHEDFGRGWCAVKTNEAAADGVYFRPENIGFEFTPSASSPLQWDSEKYPALFMWQDGDDPQEIERKQADASYAKAHFMDLLGYMEEHEEFLDMMTGSNGEYPDLDKAREYVSKNGVIIYGFVFMADKETLKALLNENEVYSIDVKQR